MKKGTCVCTPKDNSDTYIYFNEKIKIEFFNTRNKIGYVKCKKMNKN